MYCVCMPAYMPSWTLVLHVCVCDTRTYCVYLCPSKDGRVDEEKTKASDAATDSSTPNASCLWLPGLCCSMQPPGEAPLVSQRLRLCFPAEGEGSIPD